jgi:hypothetical protein
VAGDAVLATERHDLRVPRRVVVELVSAAQHLGVEGLRSNENLMATGPRHPLDQILLSMDLRVALREERQLDPLRDHRVQKVPHVRVLVEVVGREHDEPDAAPLRSAKARERRLERLAAHAVAGNLDHRAEVARVRTSPCRIHAEHRHRVTREVSPRRRLEHGRIEPLLPAPFPAVDRSELSGERVFQDGRPDDFRLGDREGRPPSLEHGRVARHRVRAADDRLRPAAPRMSGEIERAV